MHWGAWQPTKIKFPAPQGFMYSYLSPNRVRDLSVIVCLPWVSTQPSKANGPNRVSDLRVI